jgi:hypothetical protein
MERSLGVIGMGGVVAVLLAGMLSAGGAADQAGAGGVAGGRTFSSEARRRAILESAWTQAMEARCTAPSPFAAPTVLPAVC